LIALALDRLPEDGLFVLEHSVDHDFKDHPACFDQRRYGSVHMSFFSLEAQASLNED